MTVMLPGWVVFTAESLVATLQQWVGYSPSCKSSIHGCHIAQQ